MIAELAAALPAHLAACASRLAVGGARGGVPASSIAGSRDGFSVAAAPFLRNFPAGQERAALSYWSQHYFAALVVPVLAAAVRLGRVMPLDLHLVDCDLDENGLIERFRLPHAGAAASPDALDAAVAVLVRDHLRPFIEGCAGWSGVSRRLLWCNAGVMLDYAAGELGVAPSTLAAIGRRHEVRERRDAPPGRAAPPRHAEAALFEPFRPCAPGRKRRVCCLRLRLPGIACCGATCPLEDREGLSAGTPASPR